MEKASRSQSDARTIAFAIIAGAIAAALYFFLSADRTDLPTGQDETVEAEDSFAADAVGYGYSRQRGGSYYAYRERKAETFDFDPNTADSTTLLRLGLAPYQVRGIYKYRAMGGVYHQKEDFARVQGLTVRDYRRLAPHIVIGDDYLTAAMVIKRPSELPPRDTVAYPLKIAEGQTVALNTADTTLLKRVPGLGSYFARAVVRYREQLGGYASASQLMEIGGFPEEALRYVEVDTTRISRLNLNRATLEELRRHPYLRYYRAKRIVDYRRLHGPIRSLRQLLPSPEFDESDIARLAPYVEY